MIASKLLTLGNAIRLMLLIGCVAFFTVIVQSCQPLKTDLELYAQNSLKRLTVLDNPPAQPSAQFRTATDEVMRLSDYRGQVVLLNVWATWCAPCIKEMPSLSRLQEMRGSPEFQVVTVSLDRTAEEAAEWLTKKNLTNITPWHDESFNLNVAVQAPGLPMSVFYSADGRELARLPGDAEWDSDEALALVDYLVGQ